MTVKENVVEVKRKIEEVLRQINKNIEDITIIAVTKTANLDMAEEVVQAGITDIGENRMQEAEKKYNYLAEKYSNIRWHLIGHLQTNKVKKAVKIFDLIHSIDSIKLAEKINKEAEEINKEQKVLIEVNVSKEDTKFGLKKEDVFKFLDQVEGYKNLKVLGLMTIAPFVDDNNIIRSCFRKLKELYEEIDKKSYQRIKMTYLSMGMTEDFKEALLEGSNMLRIGRAFFN